MSGERQDTEQENPEAGLPTEQCSRGELCRRIDLLTITVTELSRRAAEAGDRAKALLDQKFNLVVAPPPDVCPAPRGTQYLGGTGSPQ